MLLDIEYEYRHLTRDRSKQVPRAYRHKQHTTDRQAVWPVEVSVKGFNMLSKTHVNCSTVKFNKSTLTHSTMEKQQ
jgi:hypothetical protein